MPSKPPAAAVAAVALAAGLGAQNAPYTGPEEDLPRAVAPQPVPFSHRLHADRGVDCSDCHPGSSRSERAGLPDRDACMVCHQVLAADRPGVRSLAALPPGSRIAWVRVYRVPDFVFFSHQEHAAAEVDCPACHGPVAARHELQQELSTSMEACMNCHVERGASIDCHLCHDLGQ